MKSTHKQWMYNGPLVESGKIFEEGEEIPPGWEKRPHEAEEKVESIIDEQHPNIKDQEVAFKSKPKKKTKKPKKTKVIEEPFFEGIGASAYALDEGEDLKAVRGMLGGGKKGKK